ncbi:MAG: nucleotidyltransferase domain-containing protein [Synergistaceae bacterium]|nr:nucleotidyltransferase domain-containing protein [Synergistota bacterium]NLM70945.1 nucleotidyltransferase domain-containing protein [Synergistaceae bacterium]
MIDIDERHLKTVTTILSELAPGCEVRVFGSRVAGGAKPFSDLDLALYCKGRLGFENLRLIEEAFEESDLPFRVDVLDWHSLSNSFKQAIEPQCVKLTIDETESLNNNS